MQVIKSKNFILRPYRKGDETAVLRYMNNGDVSKYLSSAPYPYKIKDAKEWVKKCVRAGRRKKKKFLSFAIELNGKVVGGIGFDSIERREAEIGYALGKKYWNKGIASEALKLVTDFGLEQLKLKRITAHVFPQNKASSRILEKNGYKLEGLLKGHHSKNGKLSDALLYAKNHKSMNFIIIHGVYANPESNWFSWLKKELESKGHKVIVPKFPTPLGQSLESWSRVIKKYESNVGGETALIGHSLGAAFILSYLEGSGKRIKAAFLVAGFHKLLASPYDEINKSFVGGKFDWEKIKNSCRNFFVFASDNDQYIPLDLSKELAQNLGAKLKVIHKGGHLNMQAGYSKFPDLLDCILGAA